MRHFAHNIGDYAAATAHLSFIEDAAYHRLLRRYYQDEKALPSALTDCQRLVGARTKEEREAVRVVLEEFFTLQDDGWHQSRADREISVYRVKAQAARDNGTKGGRPVNREKTYPVSPSVQSEKLTTPHSPLPNSIPDGIGAYAPEGSGDLSESDLEQVRDAYAEFVHAAREQNWPVPRMLDPDRKKKLRARLKEFGMDGWQQMLSEAKSSDWIKTEFKLTFDWVLKPANFRKIIEGNYRNRAAREEPRKKRDFN